MTNRDIETIPFTSKKYANQKSIYIHKAKVDKDHVYSLISQEAHMKVLEDFGWSAAYNLWIYLCCNQDGYIENFSPSYLGQLAHKDRRTIQRAAKGLEDKGYLVRVGVNDFIFFEDPNDNGCDIGATSLEGCDMSVAGSNLHKNRGATLMLQGATSMSHSATPMSQGATSVLQDCDTGVYSNIINSINNIDNIKDNIEFSPHDKTAKASNHFEENLSHGESVITKCNNETCDTGATGFVYTSRIDGENDNIDKVVHVLDKDELRPIHTSDGVVVELPIRNILDGLSDALTNQKNEDVLREISERCELTDKQREEIDNTIELWRLGF